MAGCGDDRCTDGVTWCQDCHGHGVVNPKGKRYRIKCTELPAWAVTHEACGGTGMRECGCTPLDDQTRAVVLGQGVEFVARVELDEIEAQRQTVAA